LNRKSVATIPVPAVAAKNTNNATADKTFLKAPPGAFLIHMTMLKTRRLSVIDNEFILPDLDRALNYASQQGFEMLCVLPMFVKKAKQKDASVLLATPVGFPYGHHAIEAKLSETVLALVDGADEIEWNLNVQAIRSGDFQYLAKEINHFLPVVAKMGKRAGLRVDIESLTVEEISALCNVIGPSGVYAVHAVAGDNEKVGNKYAQLRVQLPDMIHLHIDIVKNEQVYEDLPAEIVSLNLRTTDLRTLVNE
jgi:deoxyribose-phosphate aldolase